MLSPDQATIQSLRRDIALQISRLAKGMGGTQMAAARQLGVPQPTLSKITNGRVSDLSIEFLIRVAVRAGLPITLQTGRVPEEAGAFISRRAREPRASHSKLADKARETLMDSERRLTPTQRLEAFLEHNQLLGTLQQAGRAAERARMQAGSRVA
ncbi:MAG: XRE family transcriptional regulator [Steroidobacteraceae bacterium]